MKLNQLHKSFKINGFVKIEKFFKKRNIKDILNELPKIQKKVERKSQKNFHKTKNGKFNSIHNINKFINSGKIIDLSKNKKFIKVLKKFLNDKPQLRNIEFFLKPAKNKMNTPAHQDNYFWNIINANGVNVWIACSNSSKSNGGVYYYKQSQNLGTIKHKISFNRGTSQMIPKEILKNIRFQKVYPKVSPGDIIIHNCEVIHGSDNNKSKNDRVGMVMSFKGKNSKYDRNKLIQYKKNIKINLNKIYN